MSVPVYLPNGQAVMVDEADAAAGIAAGRYTPQREFRYRVRAPSGRIYSTGGDFVRDALRHGQALATDTDVETARARREALSSPLSAVASGVGGVAESVASGATLGLSREAERAAGVSPARMRAREELAGPAATGGELLGAVAPAVLPGAGEAEGAGLLARAFGAPTEAVTRAGDVAAGAVGRGLTAVAGEPASAAGRIIRTAAEHTARGVAEGALYGAGNAIDEDALGDTQLTADSLAAHVGMGAILGGATSGLIGAGGRLAREASMGTLQALAPRFAESLSEGGLARSLAENRAFASLNPTRSDVRQALRRVGGIRGLGDILIENGIIGRDLLGRPTGEIASAIRLAMQEHGSRIGSVLRDADERAGNMGVPLAEEAAAPEVAAEMAPEPEPRRAPPDLDRHAGDRVPYTPERAEERVAQAQRRTAERPEPTRELNEAWLRDTRAALDAQPPPTREEVADGLAALDEHFANLDAEAQVPFAQPLTATERQEASLTRRQMREVETANRQADRAEVAEERARRRMERTQARVERDERQRASKEALEAARRAAEDFKRAAAEHRAARKEFQRVVGQRVTTRSEPNYAAAEARAAMNPGRPNIGIVRAYVAKTVKKLSSTGVRTDQVLARKFQREFQPFIDRVASGGDLTLEQLHAFRSRVDDMVNWSRKEPNPLEKELRGLRRVIEAEIDHRLGFIDRNLQATYRASKNHYGGLALARQMADRMMETDAMAAHSSIKAFLPWLEYTGLASLIHPGMAAIGLLGGALSVFSKKRGNQLLAAGLDRVAQMRALAKANAAVERRVTEAVSAAVSGRGSVMRRTAVRVSVEAYRERVAEAREVATNPQALVQRVGDATAGLSQVAPRTQAVLATRAATAATFLASKIPSTDSQLEGQLQPQLVQPLVPASERDKFMRYARAVDDPMTVLDDLNRGAMSIEGTETLKKVYPALYQRVAVEAGQQLADASEAVPYARRLQLGMLLDTATDPTMVPGYLQSVAMVTSAGDAQANAGMGPKGNGQQTRPLKLNMHTQPSTTGQLEERMV